MNAELNNIIALIYGAALDDAKWDRVLEACGRLGRGGVRTCLFGYDMEAQVDLGARQHGYDPDYEESYAEYYSEKDVIAHGLIERGSSEVMPYGAMWNDRRLYRTEFYHDWVRPQEDITGGCSVLLFNQEQRLFAFSGSIRAKDSEHLDKPWELLVNQLAPHMRQAFEITRALAAADLEKRAMVNVQDPGATACLVIAPDRTIVFGNAYAETMLATGEVLGHDSRRRLVFSEAGWNDMLGDALAKLTSNGLFHPQTLALKDSWTGAITTCRIAPLRPEVLGFQPSGLLFDSGELCFLLTISHRKDSSDLSALLKQRFGLTPSEAQVAVLLADGLSTREVSDQRGTSFNTARNQVQSIMGKMEIRRQSELVRIIDLLRFGNS